jgi:hypothetical protein
VLYLRVRLEPTRAEHLRARHLMAPVAFPVGSVAGFSSSGSSSDPLPLLLPDVFTKFWSLFSAAVSLLSSDPASENLAKGFLILCPTSELRGVRSSGKRTFTLVIYSKFYL